MPTSPQGRRFQASSRTPSGRFLRKEFLARGHPIKTQATGVKEILARLVGQDIKQIRFDEHERRNSAPRPATEMPTLLGDALRDIEHAKNESEQINALKQWREVILRARGDLEEEFAVILKYHEARQQREAERAKTQTTPHEVFAPAQQRIFPERKRKKPVNYARLASATRYPQHHFESVSISRRRNAHEADKGIVTQSGGRLAQGEEEQSDKTR